MEDSTTLSPGFRFHPTDEELVRYFLKRKLTGRQFLIDAIAVVEIYKFEPWDLPSHSKLKTRDLEWYFFTALDRKYGSGSRTNRATDRGYWKTTGKDRPVKHADRTVGMKKTLVYHLGRAPHGQRSNWVMHEYRMVDEELTRAGVNQDAFVVCRIFEKSGPGPKNGEKYGAPLEEALDDEEEAPVPVLVAGRVGAFAGADDLNPEKKLDMAIARAGFPSKFYHGECSSYPGHHQESIEDQKPLVDTDGVFKPQIGQGFNMTEPYAEDVNSLKDGDDVECISYPEHHQVSIEDLEPLVGTDGVLEPQIDQAFNMTEPYAEDIYSLNDGGNGELGHNGDPVGFFDAIGDMELYFDANDLPPVADGSYLETNDLLNPVSDPYGTDMLEAFLSSYSDEDDVSKYICFDSPKSVEGENSDPAPPFIQQNVEGVTDDVGAHSSNKAAKEAAAALQLGSESTNPLVKRANSFLANIPAPPAFASEYPSKDMALRFHSSPQSSNAAHVTTGMVSITPRGNPVGWIVGKNGMLNTIISAGCSHLDVASVAMIPVLYTKTAFVLSHGWIFLILFSVLLLSMSYKIACCMYTSK